MIGVSQQFAIFSGSQITNGKIWLITGATRGLGASIARAPMAAGGRVVATGRNTMAVETSLEKTSENLLILRMDVNDEARVAAAVKDDFRGRQFEA